MTRNDTVRLATMFLAGTLACAAPAGYAAETAQSTALATQTGTMDSLAPTRGETTVSSRISADFAIWAGSSANAEALVTGLRNGSEIKLVSTSTTTSTPSTTSWSSTSSTTSTSSTVPAASTTTSTTFTPPTGKMGHGNVYISLALAKEQLAAAGITRPTAEQLQASLMGGTVTTSTGKTTLDGVLEMRSQNMGWGQIAQSLGFKLGPVISGMKSTNAKLSALPATPTTTSGTTTSASRGIVTGAGGASSGKPTTGSSRGMVTGTGGAVGSGNGHAYGRGIVSAGGAAAGASGVKAGGKALGKAQ